MTFRLGSALALAGLVLAAAPLRSAHAQDASKQQAAPAASHAHRRVPARQTPAQADGGSVSVDARGDGILLRGEVTTKLSPDEFYRLVGREDLAEAFVERQDEKNTVVYGGAVVAALGGAALIGDFIYVLGSVGSPCGYKSESSCGGHPIDTRVSWGLLYGGLGAIGLGFGAIIVGNTALHPDEGGARKRIELVDASSAAEASPSAPKPAAPVASRSPLETLRVNPLLAPGARGVTIGLSF